MSFVQGFEKVAMWTPARGVGQVAGTVSRGAKAISGGIKNLTTGQRAARLEGYRIAGKAPVGGTVANIATQKFQKANPGVGFSELAAKAEQLQKTKRKQSLTRLDKIKAAKSGQGQSFVKKHPYLAAAGAYGAYRMMSGGQDQQQPPPPPQIVQY